MPTYEYQCEACGNEYEEFLPMSRFDEPQNCPSCGEVGRRVVSVPDFILRGEGWVSHNARIKSQMMAKRERIANTTERERRMDAPLSKLVPNFNGERAESWREASEMAKKEGISAESYVPMIQKEQAEAKR